MTRLVVAIALLALAVLIVGFKTSPTSEAAGVDYKASWQTARTYAKRYRAQRDDLQERLTRRVLDVRRMERALRRKIAVASDHPLERGMLCIHTFEGSWSDPHAPFWGGLQMDRDFQETYGSEFLRAFGTADRWPVSVQIAVAIRAYLSGRGYHPWPNTARACGLIG